MSDVDAELVLRALRGDRAERSSAPLILLDIEGRSTAEAATIMNPGEAAFKSRLERARLAVRAAIDGYVPEDNA
jgi:DNA-directed RNA polymerase specialized sigma24 family protein